MFTPNSPKLRQLCFCARRKLRILEREKALTDLKQARTLERLRKRLCELMEQEIILGVAQATLDVS